MHDTRFMIHLMRQTGLMHRTSFMHEMAGSALGPRAGRPAKAIKEILLKITFFSFDASNESSNESSNYFDM